jgi:hypothetical protein
MPVTVTLPDGTLLQLPGGATGADAAAAIGPGLAKAALAVEVSDPNSGTGSPEVRDLSRALPDGAHVSILTKKSGPQALALIRHDAAHVLAAAVMELWPGVKISIGPPRSVEMPGTRLREAMCTTWSTWAGDSVMVIGTCSLLCIIRSLQMQTTVCKRDLQIRVLGALVARIRECRSGSLAAGG